MEKSIELDSLTCPKCQSQMRSVAFIEDEEVIEKTLKHLRLLGLKVRLPPKVKAPFAKISIDDSDSQVLFSTLPSIHIRIYLTDYNRVLKPR